jgi:hypothetical protein
METQAAAPGQPQAQEPVHPIHQEAQDLATFTKIVSETPDNDPDHPENTSAPQAEAPAEEPKQEAQEPEQFELPEDEPLFEIEYKTDNGKEQKKLSLKELREGYLAKQDYHRNIQKVKAEQAEIAQKVQQAQLQAQQEYVQRIELHKQAVQKLAGVKTMQEIETLSREDPAAAQQEFLRLISVNQTMTALEAERQQAMAQHQQALQAAQHQAITKARETLEAEIPGWNADLYNNVLGTVAKEYGFKNEEVAPVVDARLIKVFHDAAKYRQLQQAKPEVSKRVVAIPKVVKPGSAEKPNPAREAVDELSARLKKTGRGEDFVALYLAKQKQQKGK